MTVEISHNIARIPLTNEDAFITTVLLTVTTALTVKESKEYVPGCSVQGTEMVTLPEVAHEA